MDVIPLIQFREELMSKVHGCNPFDSIQGRINIKGTRM